jgi:hypothetical protein
MVVSRFSEILCTLGLSGGMDYKGLNDGIIVNNGRRRCIGVHLHGGVEEWLGKPIVRGRRVKILTPYLLNTKPNLQPHEKAR